MANWGAVAVLLFVSFVPSSWAQRVIRTQPVPYSFHLGVNTVVAAGLPVLTRNIRLYLANITSTAATGVTVTAYPLVSSFIDRADAGCDVYTFSMVNNSGGFTPIVAGATVSRGPFTINAKDGIEVKIDVSAMGQGGPAMVSGNPCLHRSDGALFFEITIPSDSGALTGRIRSQLGLNGSGITITDNFGHGQLRNAPIEVDIMDGKAF